MPVVGYDGVARRAEVANIEYDDGTLWLDEHGVPTYFEPAKLYREA